MTTGSPEEIEEADIALIEDMDKLARLVDPEHSHYEGN